MTTRPGGAIVTEAAGVDGDTNGTGGGGNGIPGMLERANALGGSLEASPRANGGYFVRARLPLSVSR